MENTPGLKEFDPKKERDVKWLAKFTDCVNMLGGDEKACRRCLTIRGDWK